jgi:purine-binding chemotaxis protein CheW
MQPDQAFVQQLSNETDLNEEMHIGKDFLLSFVINNSLYAICFEDIQEIVDYFPYTEYPLKLNDHMGIINLRGNILPIINPFRLSKNDIDPSHSKYIILKSSSGSLMGLVVGNIKKIEIDSSDISEVVEEKIISFDKKPLRFVRLNYLTKKYKEKLSETE